MSGAEISLIAVTAGFILLLAYVYSPSRKRRLESYGAMPLEKRASEQQPGEDEGEARLDDGPRDDEERT